MNTLRITMTGILLLAFTMNIIGAAESQSSPDELVDDIEEYNGSIGPDNALYGLKLAFEGIDESFTLNATEKLEKKIYHSRLRISEAKTELKKKNDEGAKKAFEHYKEKINETEESILNKKGNDSVMIYAQKKIDKHQYVLERLLELHPNNTGLLNAYNKSVELEDKFEEKTQMKLERVQTEGGKHYLKEVKKEKIEEKEGNGLEEFKNELKLNAKIIDNNSQIEIKLNFISDKTDNLSIADGITKELRLSKDNISSILKTEDSDHGELKSILKAQAEIGLNVSSTNVDYMFALDKTNSTEIIEGIYNKLLNLTTVQILDVLEINSIQDGRKQEEKDTKSEEKNKGPEKKSGIKEGRDQYDTRQDQNDKRGD
jgi:hypothetical protein